MSKRNPQAPEAGFSSKTPQKGVYKHHQDIYSSLCPSCYKDKKTQAETGTTFQLPRGQKGSTRQILPGMTDHQKIHPTYVEAPSQSTPLAWRELLRSEYGDPADHHPPVMWQHPPYHRTIPNSNSKPPKKRSCCCRCLCWTVCLFLILVVAVAAIAGILYLVFQPKLPTYSVNRLQTSAFSVNLRLNVNASFNVTVTTKNPNKKIGIYYEDNSHLSVWYTDARLCTGSSPVFYQGHQNTTVLTVVLTGHAQMGSNLLTALEAQQQTGMVPLIFKGDVPVRVKFGGLKLRKVRFLVTCNLVVNSLSVDNQIRIRTSSCRFKLRL